jgi:riboflavin biosynthesis pyrimidine reductase
MMSSIDGRIVPGNWSPFERGRHYEDIHAALGGDAWICGRITMQGYTRGERSDDRDEAPVSRTDHIARADGPFAIALDFHGRLHWGARNEIEGDHVVVAVGEQVSDAHLNALRTAGVSYLFCGQETLDLRRLLAKLREKLGIRRLLVEGGGGINGAFLEAGLVDEISLLLAPTVDGSRGIPAVFDHDPVQGAGVAGRLALSLSHCEQRQDGIVWLRYRVSNAEAAASS